VALLSRAWYYPRMAMSKDETAIVGDMQVLLVVVQFLA